MKKTLAVSILLLCISRTPALGYAEISADSLHQWISRGVSMFLLDVREQNEYDVKHIKGTVLYPWNTQVLQARYMELPLQKPIIVICLSGARSASASAFLDTVAAKRFSGFVYHLTNGMNAWTYEVVDKAWEDSVAQAQSTLEIHIIATQASMDSGYFKVEFHDFIDTLKSVELGFALAEGIQNFLFPYISAPGGSFEIDSLGEHNWSKSIIYNFNQTGSATYGYKVKPIARSGTGLCNSDIAIWDLYQELPTSIKNKNDIHLTFEVPEGMRVFAPFRKSNSDREYLIKGVGVNYKSMDSVTGGINLSTAAWGNFTYIDSLVYGDHVFYMLGYNTGETNVFRMMKFSYPYFMRAFENNLELLPPSNVVVMLPPVPFSDNIPESSREQQGGFYNPSWGGDVWEPDTTNYHYHGYANAYLNYAYNLNDITVNGVHCIAHSTLNPYGHWWICEGIAVYYQMDLPEKIGIYGKINREREFIEHLKYYKNEIVSKGLDEKLTNDKLETDVDWWIRYKKAALAFYAIDKIIEGTTNGEKELIDFWAKHYSDLSALENIDLTDFAGTDDLRYQLYIDELKEMTGRNFQDFFGRYVFSAQPLPLEIQGDSIVVTRFLHPVSTSRAALTLNDTYIDSTSQQGLVIYNDCISALAVSAITSGSDAVTAAPSSATIPVGDSLIVTVSFSPKTAAALNDSLVITSNAQGEETIALPLSGKGVTVKPGDLDNNSKVNIFDLIELLKVLGGKSQSIKADVNKDSVVNIFDLIDLLKLFRQG